MNVLYKMIIVYTNCLQELHARISLHHGDNNFMVADWGPQVSLMRV